jgi:DNA primase
MFPIGDERERIVAFGGRALSEQDRAKYINSPETVIYGKKRTLYGLDNALPELRKTRRAYIGEGYLDVIAMHQSELRNTVAPLGTAFTDEQAKLLKRWVDEVVLVFDADSAGLNASFKAAIVAERAGLGCFAVRVPAGKDPDDLYREHGAASVQEMVSAPQPVFDFMMEALSERLDTDEGANRELLLQRVFPYISIINSEVRREGAIDALSDLLGVSARAVQADFERWRKGEQPQRVEQKSADQHHHTLGRDVALMLATAQDGGLFAYLRSRLSSDQLQDRLARELFLLMEDAFRHEEPLPRGLIDRLTEESVRNSVLERLTSGEFTGWKRQDVDRAVRLIRIRALESEAHQVETDLRRLSASDGRTQRELLEKKMAIDQELGNLKVRADD